MSLTEGPKTSLEVRLRDFCFSFLCFRVLCRKISSPSLVSFDFLFVKFFMKFWV